MSKSYPIIMQGFSVEGIIAGRKLETRRLTGLKEINKYPNEWRVDAIGEIQGKFAVCMRNKHQQTHSINVKCPYGVVGDELWVRESFAEVTTGNKPHDAMLQLDNFPIYVYKEDEFNSDIKKWKSPLFMPRKASRITLINEGVSIERLHDITEEGALREGIEFNKDGMYQKDAEFWFGKENIAQSAKDMYKNLWSNMHGKESWNLNPYLWVLKFSVKEIK